MKLKGLFYGLFYEMLAGNYIITTDAEQNRNLLSIKKVLDYISAHYREPLSVKELSSLSNYSEFYFMKLFKQYTGKTAAAYLNDYRLEKAKSLLLHTDGIWLSPVCAEILAMAISGYFLLRYKAEYKY